MMGMYTELHFNAELKKDTPDHVVQMLRFMVGEAGHHPFAGMDHDLFKTDRWRFMLNMDSAYFVAPTHSTLTRNKYRCTDPGPWVLSVRCNFKDYTDELKHFIDWIMPYVDADEDDLLGFSRYEETREPTLYYGKSQ